MTPSVGNPTSFGEKIPSGYKRGRLQNYDPQQMDLYNRQFGQLGPDSFLSRLAGGDQSMFEEMERPALRQFNALSGNLASKFSGMGAGARRSSGFQNTMNAAGSDFAQQLQSNRQSLQSQAIKDLMGLSDQLLNQRPYDNLLTKKKHKPSFFDQILKVFSPAGADINEGTTENTSNFLKMMMMG